MLSFALTETSFFCFPANFYLFLAESTLISKRSKQISILQVTIDEATKNANNRIWDIGMVSMKKQQTWSWRNASVITLHWPIFSSLIQNYVQQNYKIVITLLSASFRKLPPNRYSRWQAWAIRILFLSISALHRSTSNLVMRILNYS